MNRDATASAQSLSRLLKTLLEWLRAPEVRMASGERRRDTGDQARERAGAIAERCAGAYLRRKGYRILCRNRVNAIGELDIVAVHRGTVVAVEVRSRSSRAVVSPKETITATKRRKLLKTTELFLRQHGMTNRPVRIDLVTVEMTERAGAQVTEHLEAFVEAKGWG